ncbi:hypothetical protein D3C76_1824090 [compost metagenome]
MKFSGGVAVFTVKLRALEISPVLTAFAVMLCPPKATGKVVFQVPPSARTVCLGTLLSWI